MTDPKDTDTTLDNFGDLPIQPTGSGVADLEIAYEQMRLAEDDDASDTTVHADASDDSATVSPTDAGEDAAAGVGHPS